VHGTLYITGDPEADRLLNNDPLALTLGMLLDQNITIGFEPPDRADGPLSST
jgi:hypothetical protein